MDDIFISARKLCIDFPIQKREAPKGVAGELTHGVSDAGRMVRKGGRMYLRAIDHLSFEARPGDRIGVWGRNGSGKTTLLRTLRGVFPPTSGELVMQGRSQAFFNIAFGMDQDANGYENIMLRGVLMGASPAEMKALTPQIAEFTELGDFLNMPLRSYSSGMRMRLAFAVAVSLPSDILLMDEWLSVGDQDFRKKAAEKLTEVVESSKILVIASHNRKLLEGACNRILKIEAGQIVKDIRIDSSSTAETRRVFEEAEAETE